MIMITTAVQLAEAQAARVGLRQRWAGPVPPRGLRSNNNNNDDNDDTNNHNHNHNHINNNNTNNSSTNNNTNSNTNNDTIARATRPP